MAKRQEILFLRFFIFLSFYFFRIVVPLYPESFFFCTTPYLLLDTTPYPENLLPESFSPRTYPEKTVSRIFSGYSLFGIQPFRYTGLTKKVYQGRRSFKKIRRLYPLKVYQGRRSFKKIRRLYPEKKRKVSPRIVSLVW